VIVSWGDAAVRRRVTFASSGRKRFTVYLRTLEPGSTVGVRLTDSDAHVETPVRVLPYDVPVTLCIAAVASVPAEPDRCSVILTPDQLPSSARAYEVVDEVLTAADVQLRTIASQALPQWRSLRALDVSGDLGLTPQVTRPMLRRGLPSNSARAVAALAAVYLVLLLVLGVTATRLAVAPTGAWLALGAVIAGVAVASAAVGRVGPGTELTVHHSSVMQQLPGTGASLVTLQAVAEFPVASRFQLRVSADDATIEASAASGRAEQRMDEDGFALLDGEFGLGARRAFVAEATVNTQWLAVEDDDHVVRVSNRSALAMRDCRFGAGMSIIEMGELPPGATAAAERVSDVAGPLFSCTTEQPPLSFTDARRDVALVGLTRVVVYRNRRTLRLGTSDE
jgi:hypothetical protein